MRSSKLIALLYHVCVGISIGKWKLLLDNYPTNKGGEGKEKALSHFQIPVLYVEYKYSAVQHRYHTCRVSLTAV